MRSDNELPGLPRSIGEAGADGWRMVPVEPTEAMQNAALDAWLAAPHAWAGKAEAFWSAMLAASPAYTPRPVECSVPPEGWRCTRTPGHEGPCAAVPDDDGLEEEIADAIDDSLDMDWTGSIGARAVMKLLRAKGMVA